jgi:toxin ParE1/3/4
VNSWPVFFTDDADAEALEAYDWYAARNRDAAEGFRSELRHAVARITDRPDRYRLFDGDVRRYLLRKYPFGVLYVLEPDLVIVLAVMHLKKEPGYWKKRR